MNEEKAREILGDTINSDGSLFCLDHYIVWNVGDMVVTLDCQFNADELEALAWWMRNKGVIHA